MKIAFLHTVFFFLGFALSIAQEVVVTPLFDVNEPASDSSYYNALVFNSDHVWFIGKHGIITELKDNVQRRIKHPEDKDLNFLSASAIDNNNYILTCDQGTIYYYNRLNQQWRSQQIRGYEKKCFYSVLVLNEQEFLICGGNSKIARSEKAIPHGFILKTNDGGRTWEKVLGTTFKMAWRLKKDNQNNVWVNLYRPNKSFLFVSSDNGESWKKSPIKADGLIHDFYIEENFSVLTGGKGIKDRKAAHAVINDKPANFTGLGFIWGINKSQKGIWLSAGNSSVAFKTKESTEWKVVKLNANDQRNIYGTVQVSSKVIYAFGSGKRIYRITLME